MLEDHYISGVYMSAGTTQSTIDVGGLLPIGWVPTPNVDPLDTPAVNAFYAVGPAWPGPISIKPVTYWTEVQPPLDFSPADFSRSDFNVAHIRNSWSLTGLGVNLSQYPVVNI